MGIPHCGHCKLRTEECLKNPLCPRGVLSKHKWHYIQLPGMSNENFYVNTYNAIDAMVEFAKNYHEQFITRTVITEKTKPTDEKLSIFGKHLD
jgi:hypothetical protein